MNSLLRENHLGSLCHARHMPRRTEDLPEEYAAYTRTLAVAIGDRIRQRRRQLHLSQESVRAQMELESVHVSRTQFSRFEMGERLPSAAEIVALVKVLHVSCSWLLVGDGEATSSTM